VGARCSRLESKLIRSIRSEDLAPIKDLHARIAVHILIALYDPERSGKYMTRCLFDYWILFTVAQLSQIIESCATY